MTVSVPYVFTPGLDCDATQVNANFAAIVAAINAQGTPPFPVASGGTGATTAAGALTNLGLQSFVTFPCTYTVSGSEIIITPAFGAPTSPVPPVQPVIYSFVAESNLAGPFTMALQVGATTQSPVTLYDGPAPVQPTQNLLIGQVCLVVFDPVANSNQGGWVLVNPQSPSPIGQIAYFPFTGAPSGWVACNGQQLSRSLYPALAAIALANVPPFGIGDGSTTFNVPNLAGYFMRGWDNSGTVDPTPGGRTFGSIQADDYLAHTHVVNNQPDSVVLGGGSSYNRLTPGPSGTSPLTGGLETRPKNVALLPCIRLF